MALVDVISIGVMDDDKDHKSIPIYVPAGTYTVAELTAYGQELCSAIDAITDMRVDDLSITLSAALPGGLKADPIADSEVQKGALFTFTAANSSYKHSTFVPGITPSLFNEDNLPQVGDVTSFVDDIVGGFLVGATTVQATDRNGNDLTNTVKATKRFRK